MRRFRSNYSRCVPSDGRNKSIREHANVNLIRSRMNIPLEVLLTKFSIEALVGLGVLVIIKSTYF